jgi:hypothetical protein
MPSCVPCPIELRLDFLPTKAESSFERLGVPSVATRTAQKRLSAMMQQPPDLHRQLASLNFGSAAKEFNDDVVPPIAEMSQRDRAIYANMLLERALRWEPFVQARTTKRLMCSVAMPSHPISKRPAFESD